MMVVPAETVEDTLNELLQFCGEGDIIIDHGNSILKILAGEHSALRNWASNILTVALVVVFMAWTVDTVLWLVVQILQYRLCPHFQGTRTRHWICAPHEDPIVKQHLLNMDGYIAVHQVLDTLSRWCIMV